MFIVDAHLDLAYNVVLGRDVTQPARRQPANEIGIASVGLPDLRAGGVGLICATIFCEPAGSRGDGSNVGYRTADEASRQAKLQLDVYRRWIDDGLITFRVTPCQPVPGDQPVARDVTETILLLEGADAICSPGEIEEWFNAGLRIVGLAWKATRYAGGTGEPGPLTAEGVRLVRELDRFGIIHDASHLAEESFWQLMDVSSGPVIATHSNCRAIVPTDRQLSDEMIRAVAQQDGMIGINFFDKFLLPPAEYGKRRASLNDVVAHVRHICDLLGDAQHVGLGTDMDGGLGREQIPVEIETSADLPRLADALADDGFSDDDVFRIMGQNWRQYFQLHLPHPKEGS